MPETDEYMGHVSLGELKAIQKDNHLCYRCLHGAVCRVATSIEPSHLIIVSQCLAFIEEEGLDGN